jgi:acetolactate synthase small subunit
MLKRVTFVVSAENHPDVLARIVLLLHRLPIEIRSFHMQRPRHRRKMILAAEVDMLPEQADRIAASLLKVVQVLSVEALPRNPINDRELFE